jgi:hypothetical protein
MKNPFKKNSKIDEELERLAKELELCDPCSDEYITRIDCIERLTKTKGEKRFISPDTIVVGVFSLIQIGIILNHEKLDNITSKAFGYVFKGRV